MKLTFMGTAGARFMVAKQLAASGGLYLEDGNARIALDPGPGAIVQYAKRKVDLTKLDAIVVSHRHLDHCGDVNVMVEAMTEGGFAHRGRLFCPSDALDDDPVVLKYLRRFPQEVVRLQPETDLQRQRHRASRPRRSPRAPGGDVRLSLRRPARLGDRLRLLRRHRRAAQGRRDGHPHGADAMPGRAAPPLPRRRRADHPRRQADASPSSPTTA